MKAASVEACLPKPVRSLHLLNTLATAWSKRAETAGLNLANLQSHVIPTEAASIVKSGESVLRVLVVEDNVVNQRVATRMLQNLGIRVDVAGNGREAIEMFEMLPYDLILMDCQMPELDGYEAAAEIRRRERSGKHVVIIATTADATAAASGRCSHAGMDDYLTKPLRLEEVIQAVRKWTFRREPESTAALSVS